MLRRIAIVLCLAVIAVVGIARPWADGETQVRRTSIEASGRLLGAALAIRGKLAREGVPVVWLPASSVQARDAGPGETLLVLTHVAGAADAPLAPRQLARAPPAGDTSAILDTGGCPAAGRCLPS